MRKLILLLTTLVLTLAVNATRQTISPSSEESDSNIRSALSGSADTIILNAGNYKEADQIHFRRNAVIMAAEGADVIITPKYYCDLVYENTKVKIIGIKFDGSVSGQQAIRVYDNNAGKELRLENCEFYNFAKDVISGDDGAKTIDSCIINNCYFHNNTYSPIYFNKSSVEGKQTIYGLIVKNSTFANNNPSLEYRSVIDVQSYNREATDEIEVVVDHCTFYNNTTKNYDYSAVRTRIVNRTTVSNCIFAHPSAIEFYATNVWAGSVTNCLAYNFNKGYMSGPTRTNTNTGDPLFTDAANGDFSYAGNWVTMSLSPARGAATDGSDLGDPRWYTAETLPSTSFASDYDLFGTKALLTGNIRLNASNHIEYYNNSDNGIAKWKLHVERTCRVSAVVDVETGCTSGRQLTLTVKDADGNTVATLAQAAASYNDADINLGEIVFAEAGDYTFILTNSTSYSSAVLEKIILSYTGGAATSLPGTLAFSDAALSAKAHITDGMLYFNTIGDSNPVGQWAQWTVTTDHDGKFLFTMNVSSTNGQSYKITILDEGSNEVDSYEKNFSGSGDYTIRHYFPLTAGNYFVKVENTRAWSQGHLVSLVVTEPSLITLDETSTDISAIITANLNAGVKDYQLIRTLKAGMYNTFCSPLYIPSDVCKEVFGADVEIYTLDEAIVDGTVLNVTLHATSDVWQGTPVFIRPSHDIVNPILAGVELKVESPAHTTRTNANFIGTFVKTTLTGGADILYLGPDNTLYYPEEDTPIKGMRGWFAIKDAPSPAPSIKRMNIVNAPTIPTDINYIESKTNGTIKTIENGQLILIRDGIRYNVMGTKIQ